MLNVFVDCGEIYSSGIGRYTREILKRIASRDVNVVCSLKKEDLPRFKNEFPGFNFEIIDSKRYSLLRALLNPYPKGYDIYFVPYATVLPFFSGCNFIVTIHDMCPVAMREFFGIRVAIFYWLVLFFQILISKKIVCISEFTKNEVLKYFPFFNKRKMAVVYNGFSPDLFDFKNEIKSQGDYFLVVGNVKKHKNVSPLIDWWLRNSLNKKLIVVGEVFIDSEKFDLLESKDIEIKGKVDDKDLCDLYYNARAVIMPSLYEGFGLPMLEAMHFKKAILASDIPVFRELCGDCITYFNGKNFSGLDDALVNFPVPPVVAYEELLNYLTWDSTVNHLLELFDNEIITG